MPGQVFGFELCFLSFAFYLLSYQDVAEAAQTLHCHTDRFVLDNGLTVIVREDHSAPLAALQAWFRAGSIFEGKWLGCGISHFVEHMAFKGTPTRPVGQFAREVKAVGGDLNAYTYHDRTVFHIVVPSEGFFPCLEALSDVIQNSSFDPEETTKEKQVIVKELEGYLDHPERILHHLYEETVFQIHPYRFPVGGYISQFSTLTRGDLVDYYRAWYVPNNMVLVIVGDVDLRAVSDRVKQLFSGFSRKPLPPEYVPEEPPQLGRRRHERENANLKGYGLLRMGYHTVAITDPDVYPLDVAALVLGHGDASRLCRRLRDEKHLVYSITTYSDTPMFRGSFAVQAVYPPGSLPEVEREILGEIERLRAGGVSEEELESARNRVLAAAYLSRETVQGQAEVLGIAELLCHDIRFEQLYLERIRQVRRDDVLRVARKYFEQDNLSSVAVVPPGEGPQAKALTAIPAVAAGPSQPVLHATAGGTRLVVRATHRLPVVSLVAAFRAGVRAERSEKAGLSNFTALVLPRGTRRRSAQEIARSIESVGGALSTQGGRNTITLSLTVPREHLRRVWEILTDVLSEPSFPEEQVAQVRQEILQEIDRVRSDVFQSNQLLLHRLLFADHPYSRDFRGTPEAVREIGPEDLEEFQRRFVRPSKSVLAVSGDVDPEEILRWVADSFGSAASHEAPMPVVRPVPRLSGTLVAKENFPEKTLGAAILGFPTVDLLDPDRCTFEVLDAVLSGLGGRIFEGLRDERALAYACGTYSLPLLEAGYFAFYIKTKPGQVDAAVEEIFRQIRLLQAELVREEELRRAQVSLVGAQRAGLQTNASLAGQMAIDELCGLGYGHYLAYADKIRAIRAEDLLRVARQYFTTDRYALAVTGPLESAASEVRNARAGGQTAGAV